MKTPHRVRSPFQGFGIFTTGTRGVAPGYDRLPLRDGRVAVLVRAEGAFASTNGAVLNTNGAILSTKGAPDRSPGQRPGYQVRLRRLALKGRTDSQTQNALEKKMGETDNVIAVFCEELGIKAPF